MPAAQNTAETKAKLDGLKERIYPLGAEADRLKQAGKVKEEKMTRELQAEKQAEYVLFSDPAPDVVHAPQKQAHVAAQPAYPAQPRPREEHLVAQAVEDVRMATTQQPLAADGELHCSFPLCRQIIHGACQA